MKRPRCKWSQVKQHKNGEIEKKGLLVPLTARTVACRALPARFVATQVYSPACLAATDSMLRALMCLLTRATVTSGFLPTFSSLNSQTSVIGKSPFTIVQVAETVSPQFAGPSLIENELICGATK